MEILKVKIIGINKVISTSKIKKIIAIKKNCNEKGKRAGFFGSNPHSKGDLFSRSIKLFLEIKLIKIIIIKIIIIIIIDKYIKILIIYTKYLDLLIGSQL